MMGSKAFESPLISHARMRGLYRGLVETRALGKARGWPKGFEACWVGTALDLADGDLVNAGEAEWVATYVRALGTREAARGATRAEVRKARGGDAAEEFRGSSVDRMLCAVGQAMALKAAGRGLVVGYVRSGEMKGADWERVVAAASGRALPLIFVVTPGGREREVGKVGVPVIPVDAGDAVAIYRVAQESMVRARADGGLVVIECVDCGVDPVKLMGEQLVKKGICTERWVVGVEATFRKMVAPA